MCSVCNAQKSTNAPFSIGTPCTTSLRGCFEGLVQTMNTWPCPKLDLHRCPYGAPAAPRAQSECFVRFAHTFSIQTPRATGPRGCFEGLVQTINTWPCLQLNLPINLYMPIYSSIYTYIYTYIYIYFVKVEKNFIRVPPHEIISGKNGGGWGSIFLF